MAEVRTLAEVLKDWKNETIGYQEVSPKAWLVHWLADRLHKEVNDTYRALGVNIEGRRSEITYEQCEPLARLVIDNIIDCLKNDYLEKEAYQRQAADLREYEKKAEEIRARLKIQDTLREEV